MPLQSSALSSALQDIFAGAGGYPADETEAGKKWAAAYRSYAAAALAGTTLPLAPSLAAAETLLATQMASAFSAAKAAGAAGLTVLVTALDTAFVGFWLLPPMAFALGTSMAGVVTVAPPGVLSGVLSGVFSSGSAPGSSAAVQASAISSVLDAWTRTVMVVNTPLTPPGPPLAPVPLS